MNWEGCQIEPFGSVVTGLGIKSSDVDCYVALPPGELPSPEHVVRARRILGRYNTKFTRLLAITNAKVPIVKFLHIPTQCHCDVNFKSPAGVRNSKLLAFLLHWDRRALPLAILIKYWAKLNNFIGTNRMGNYALMMMVVFYLQLKNILPAVYRLQANVPSYMVDGWNTAFDESMRGDGTNTESLYHLMGDFFKCLSTFNFAEFVISPYLGRAIPKKCFENFDLPDEFHLYKQHVTVDVRKKINIKTKVCVQDPFDHARNCTVGVYERLVDKILFHFNFAAHKFSEQPSHNFLKVILTQDPNSRPISKALPPHLLKHNKIQKANKTKQKQKGLRTGLSMLANNRSAITVLTKGDISTK
ncbi:poly(A) RNA polymerase cid11-like isoform X2 [Spodoptera litura]|uniref:Poly(A) RNA polymerase cid11-like isoform X2 n=1 Tax=Spodoptera litura TaxID=69820 RepID=A0A9J7IVJ1_SPOLT|nr:poly(A) RNA polymerase cid11-like isoform X2 [Spodoptera litura]